MTGIAANIVHNAASTDADVTVIQLNWSITLLGNALSSCMLAGLTIVVRSRINAAASILTGSLLYVLHYLHLIALMYSMLL